MITFELNTNWTMQIQGQEEKLQAVVPGSVYHDLMMNGKMADPFWRDNEDEALKIMEQDFIYETSFDVPEDILGSDEVLLHCEGLDTIASLYVNGICIGNAENMHRCYEFPVKEQLNKKDNKLMIIFASPVKYIRERYAECITMGSEHCMDGFPQIRKAHCMFGWDWGPRLPDAGIWRGISLYGISGARIDGVYITQEHAKDSVTLKLEVDARKKDAGSKTDYTVEMIDPDGERKVFSQSPEKIVVNHPKLWWPNGFGSQPLYEITVSLYTDGIETDVWRKRIGLRTMTMHQEKDCYGESFAHEVNGVQIFAMGADYIPEDSIYSKITRDRTRILLEQCKEANFNCVRVWGGGYYPDDYFYDICDELGLVVWQDFMFACAVYELTDAFEQNIRSELIDNIKRIRHHACLGLWCGNNEMEMFVDQGTWVNTLKQKADYIKMYEYIFPQILKQYDPNAFYWPASPSSGGSFDMPNDPDRGDVHYWDVWHGDKPFSEYRKYYFRYASEFGFQSFPCLKTVENYTLPKDRNIFSYIMEKHQRNDAANGKIMNYLYQTFLYPEDFGTLLYASQLLQAEAIKYGVEHFRRNRGRCMGAVYWQLNDCWPAASWSSIDYYGRWKALHYYAKKFFAPILLSCMEEGVLTQNTNVNAQPFKLEKSVCFNISNETMEDHIVTVKWAVRDRFAGIIREEEEEIKVASLSAGWLPKKDLPLIDIYKEYISYDLYEGGRWLSGSTVILSLPKHFQYENPHLTVSMEGEEVVIHADAYAKSVEVLNEEEDLILSDNYFDMNAGERRLRVLRGEPVHLRVRSVYDIR